MWALKLYELYERLLGSIAMSYEVSFEKWMTYFSTDNGLEPKREFKGSPGAFDSKVLGSFLDARSGKCFNPTFYTLKTGKIDSKSPQSWKSHHLFFEKSYTKESPPKIAFNPNKSVDLCPHTVSTLNPCKKSLNKPCNQLHPN